MNPRTRTTRPYLYILELAHTISIKEAGSAVLHFSNLGVFKDWLAGILSRVGFEEKMDAAWKSCPRARRNANVEMTDIFDGQILQDFKGPDGMHFGIGGDEGRYVFSLCVDYFNPLGNKQAGKKKSVGLVSLVCLNLPLEMRYKPENMFLFGVIPGPREPPLACLNHYLKFLVNEFLELWTPGVRFSRTREYFYGRVVRCALICLVCDLIQARKTAGFAGIKHTQMCALCHCMHKKHGLGNTDMHSWARRTNDEYRESAQRYQDAPNQKARTDVVAETGIRWSELLRLPYFDPSRFVVVDAMHNLFLGLIQEHFEILGIKLAQKEEDQVAFQVSIPPDAIAALDEQPRKSMHRLISLLQSPLRKRIESFEFNIILKKMITFHCPALALACDSLRVKVSVLPEATNKTKFNKADFARSLLTWRAAQPENGAHPSNYRRGNILSEKEVNVIRADIENMITPSWLASVPTDLGEPCHGKLKADQWRTLASVHLPISLMRLWEKIQTEPDDTPSKQRKKLLDATLSLISAVVIGTSHTMSSAKANLYLQHMQAYLTARIPTNFRIGQLEETITKSFVRSANLRALLLKDGCPSAIRNCHSFFTKLTNPDIRNSVLIDFPSFFSDLDDETTIDIGCTTKVSEETFKALCTHFNNLSPPRKLQHLSSYTMDGRTFSTVSRHRGNSSVLIQSVSSRQPAQIQEILQTSSSDVLFVVRYFRKTKVQDPFVRYPFLQISLWEQSLGQLVIVQPHDIVCHFASTPFALQDEKDDHLAVVSLCRDL
ncbi:hypothetical protein NLJ89_g8636 [Agrocybe chaxingu]|uniref:Transposase domain-containing protein n=1 Tax=Agrocybe chaxingu TaxID=84603 RepID=A0A9W8MQL2_9AGAR|nr:hypothetical protein NLJ89_g8636 [Agrocybe chaxingu]